MMLLNLRKSAINTELGNFFKSLHNTDVAKQVVTSSARLDKKSNIVLLLNLIANWGPIFTKMPILRRGMDTICLLSTATVKVPRQKEVVDYFGALHPQKGEPRPLARVSQLYDVMNKFTVDASIGPYCIGERELAFIHAFQLRATDLLLLDRGYPSFLLFKMIIHSGANYCARVKLDQWTAVKIFYESNQDATVFIHPGAEAKKQCQELGLDITPIRLRLVRIDLAGGEIEILHIFD